MPKKSKPSSSSNPFLKSAHLILPYLTPQELSSVSLTCKTLNHLSSSVTGRRSLDASRSLENFSIPFCSNTADRCPYAYFLYTPSQVAAFSQSPPRQPWGYALDRVSHSRSRPVPETENGSPGRYLDGADSVRPSGLGSDSASQLVGAAVRSRVSAGTSQLGRDSLSRLGCDSVSQVAELGMSGSGCWCERCKEEEEGEAAGGDDDDDGIGYCCPCWGMEGMVGIRSECGPGCECGLDCANRLTQRGISVRLKIVRDEMKGWGLYADEMIKRGQFVCEYTGELLTTEEARRRQQVYDKLVSSSDGQFSSALLVVREHLPSGKACLRINIDATRIGNIARFINHSCDGGNLSTVLVRSSGTLLPRLCFFASKDIEKDRELTFSYGDVRVRSNGLRCFCGTSCCFGTLPSENT